MNQDKTFLDKINKSFFKSLKNFDFYDRSPHWEKITNKKNFENLNELENFRNNKLSYGHDDSNYYTKDTFEEEIKILINEIGEKYFFQNLKKKNIGNLKNFFIFNNRSIDPGDLHLIKYFFDLEKYIFNNCDIKIVCEIGGGYGGLTEKIINKYDCKYIMIDLPETNCLSTFYLSKTFPDKKVFIYSDFTNNILNKKVLDENDIIIIPPNVEFREIEIDLFINTRSMMEMKFSTISKYFELIHKNISKNGFFFNANRYIKFRAGQPIFLKDYPYDKFWKVISSSKSFNQDHIHQLITERKYDINSKEIKLELDKILEETKNYLQPDEFRYLNRNYFKEKNYFLKAVKKLLYHFSKLLFRRNYNKFKQKLYALYNKINK